VGEESADDIVLIAGSSSAYQAHVLSDGVFRDWRFSKKESKLERVQYCPRAGSAVKLVKRLVTG